jgi:hypothetical protein
MASVPTTCLAYILWEPYYKNEGGAYLLESEQTSSRVRAVTNRRRSNRGLYRRGQ